MPIAKRIVHSLVAAAIIFPISVGTQAQTRKTIRKITQIEGNLYRFQNNFHYSVFAVTSAGVIATDPINAEAAQWLLAEIKKRFNQPVRYVIYSHDHRDHVAGGEVFKKAGATIIAHRRAKAVIEGEKRPTALPDITFQRRMSLTLGDTTVHLRYVGKNHSDNSIVMLFPAQRALFAVDFIPVKTVAFRTFPDAYMPGWIQSLRRVERMDFDKLLPGHGPIGTKADVTAFREYLTDLRNAVLAGARAGKTLEQLKAEITLPKYQGWGQYKAWFKLNIEGMYRLVQANRRGN